MSYKVKSTLYFASLILAVVTYYNFGNVNRIKITDVVENTISEVTTVKMWN